MTDEPEEIVSTTTTIPSPSHLPFTTYIEETNPGVPYHGVIKFLTSTERDVILRLIQYSLRYILFLRRVRSRKPPTVLFINLLGVVSFISALRRILNLYNIREASNGFAPISYLKGKKSSIKILRESLDLISTISDNIYLFSNLSLLPISRKSSLLADQISDLSALACSLLGLFQTSTARTRVYKEGRSINVNLKSLEDRYERREFWEEGRLDEATNMDDAVERKKLKSKIRQERLKLKGLREEANTIWWERLRLSNEAIFAAYDLTKVDLGHELIKSTSGIVAATILFSQRWSEYLKTG